MAFARVRFSSNAVPSKNARSMRVHPNSLAARIIVVNTVVPSMPATSVEPTMIVSVASVERSLAGKGCVNQRQMNERLREVAEERAASRINLLGKQADVVGARDQAVHERRRFDRAAGPREGTDKPEGAVQKAALPSLYAVGGAVPIDEVAFAQVAADRVDCRSDAYAVRIPESDNRQHEQAGVHIIIIAARG